MARCSSTGSEFDSLEELFLHLTGQKYSELAWL